MIYIKVLLAILYAALFGWIILRSKWFKVEGISSKIILSAFYLKVLFGFAFWAVYTYHYTYQETSDSFNYFKDAQVLYGAFWENPTHFFKIFFSFDLSDPALQPYFKEMNYWERAVSYGVLNDNPTIIRFNALVMFFSLGYFHTHTIVMNFVCFSGLLLMFRFFQNFSSGISTKLLFASVILPPSLLFWGAGVMKEGLLMFGLGLLFYCFVLIKRKQFKPALIMSIGVIWLLTFTKAYVLISFAPAIIFMLITLLGKQKNLFLKFMALHVAGAAFVFTLGYWVDDYNVLHMFQSKQKDFYNLAADQSVGSLIKLPSIESYADLIWNAPGALFVAYFRPHLFEVNSVMYLASALENLFYLLLLIWALIKMNKPNFENYRLMLVCLSALLGLGLLLGLITPVLGAIVRYKIPALPFLVVLCFTLMPKHLASLPSPQNLINRLKSK
jgi:hypothetical protein